MLMRIAWRNIWRQRRRTLITIGAMAAGVGLSMATIAWMDGMYAQAFDLMVSQNLGHVQVHQRDYPASRAIFDTIDGGEALVERLEALPESAAVSGRVHGFALVGTDERGDRPQKSSGVQIIGVDPRREDALTAIDAKVVRGRFLADAPAREVVLGEGLAETLMAEVGDEIVAVTQAADGSMGNDLYTVVGISRTGSLLQDRSGMFLHIDDAQDLLVLDDRIHEIALRAPDKESIGALLDATAEAVGDGDLVVRPWEEINPMLVQFLALQDVGNAMILFMVFSVAVLGILNTMLMSVFERTKELGVIRALGLRPVQMVALVMYETAALVAVSGAAGAALGLGLDALVCTYGIDYAMFMSSDALSFGGINFPTLIVGDFRWTPVFQCLIGLAVISLFASLWPAIRAARLRPVEAMRQE